MTCAIWLGWLIVNRGAIYPALTLGPPDGVRSFHSRANQLRWADSNIPLAIKKPPKRADFFTGWTRRAISELNLKLQFLFLSVNLDSNLKNERNKK